MKRRIVVIATAAFSLSIFASAANAAPSNPGFIGVWVFKSQGGMEISQFIHGTPAYKLYDQGKMQVGDVIWKLNDKRTRSLDDLKRTRDNCPPGRKVKMVLIDDNTGEKYYVWITPVDPTSGPAAAAAYDQVQYGGKGEGDDSGKPDNSNDGSGRDGSGKDGSGRDSDGSGRNSRGDDGTPR